MKRSKGPRWSEEWLAGKLKSQAQTVEVANLVAIPKPRMNGLETEYAQLLDYRKFAGEILQWEFEGIKLRLAPRTYLTIDFPIVMPDGRLEMHDTKGFMREDAAVKIKCAQEKYPFFKFVVVRKVDGRFLSKDVRDGL